MSVTRLWLQTKCGQTPIRIAGTLDRCWLSSTIKPYMIGSQESVGGFYMAPELTSMYKLNIIMTGICFIYTTFIYQETFKYILNTNIYI